MVIGNCEHVANSKKSALFFAILQCGQSNFNCNGHLVLRTYSKLSLFFDILSMVGLAKARPNNNHDQL